MYECLTVVILQCNFCTYIVMYIWLYCCLHLIWFYIYIKDISKVYIYIYIYITLFVKYVRLTFGKYLINIFVAKVFKHRSNSESFIIIYQNNSKAFIKQNLQQ